MIISEKLKEEIRKYCSAHCFNEINEIEKKFNLQKLFIQKYFDNNFKKIVNEQEAIINNNKKCSYCKVIICDIRDKYLDLYGQIFIDDISYSVHDFSCKNYKHHFYKENLSANGA